MKIIVDGELRDATPEEEAYLAQYQPTPQPVESVSSRQFKLQLLSQGLLDQVEAWVKSQSRDVQISYETSSTFVRSAPMMAEGFSTMGFTDQQVDDFFTAASQL